ncbi:hypothetical protein KC887_01285 [Candidatus Kaiserbacteria bacterium]|nr:hypothetical protein [Candidatus Kaiserbacteria bacterium]
MEYPEPYNTLIANQIAYLDQELPPGKRKRERARLDKLLAEAGCVKGRMKKEIEIVFTANSGALDREAERARLAIGEFGKIVNIDFGMSAASCVTAPATFGPIAARVWQEAMTDTDRAKYSVAIMSAIDAVEKIGLSRAQERAQAILVAAFVFLVAILSLVLR